jgi:AAA+ superfamily predicted ATPase
MSITAASKPAPSLPDGHPTWARELAELYYSGTICMFVLHGNVHDLVRCADGAGSSKYVSLPDFLSTQVFGSWDVVVSYDVGRGLRALAAGDAQRLQSMMQPLTAALGLPVSWTRDPDKIFDSLEQLIQRNVLAPPETAPQRMAIVLEHAQFLVPAGDLASLARGQAARLVRLIGWAANPYIKRLNIAFCLITERLSELSDRVVQNPHVATIEIPLPDLGERQRYIDYAVAGVEAAKLTGFTPQSLAQNSSGLSLVNLNVVLSQATSRGLDAKAFRKLKKSMIERQCQGLVEFVEPPHTLDLVVGQPEAKARLAQDAAWVSQGRLEMAPMGYLLCGAVGTGKTFLAECYAGSIGIPCVKLRNFRSKYVGETEGNLEQVLNVLRSLGPVIVIIDEADATLGDRRAEGDSGTSGRVFSMIASQMGDTRYRGRIIWMLLTCRPDLLPIDLKRQGRCEVHIPLFAPQDTAEIREMFLAMSKKNKAPLAGDAIPEVSPSRGLTGADLESILLSAKRKALLAGKETISREDLSGALAEFIPSAEGLEKEMQEIAAVLECTERHFLPTTWREKVAKPEDRTRLQERMLAIRELVDG